MTDLLVLADKCDANALLWATRAADASGRHIPPRATEDLATMLAWHNWAKALRELSTPVAAQGDEVRDLWSLEQRLTDGEFFSDYDEDLRLLGVFRRHVATLKDSSHEGG